MPLRCPAAPESKEFPFELRQLLYGRPPHFYRIVTVGADISTRRIRSPPGREYDLVNALGVIHSRNAMHRLSELFMTLKLSLCLAGSAK
jgi:hypothetical protein